MRNVSKPEPPAIVWRDPKDLKPHPEVARVPHLDGAEFDRLAEGIRARGFDAAFPLAITDAGEILDGDARWRGAVAADVGSVPCVVRAPDDAFGFACRAALDRRQLTLGQRALLADALREHLSRQYRSERAQKGVAAKAGAHLLSAADDKQEGAAKSNARQEAAQSFGVPENQLKNLAAIRAIEAQKSVAPEASVLRAVWAGREELADARARLEQEGARAEKEERKRRRAESDAKRREAAAAKTELAGLRHGDTLAELRRLRGRPEGQVRLLLLDLEPEPDVDLADVLAAGGPLLAADCTVIALPAPDAEHRTAEVLRASGLSLTMHGRLIWECRVGRLGERHRPVLLAGRGDARFSAALGLRETDVIRCPLQGGTPATHRPEELFARLLELATLEGEVVLFPFGGSGAGYVAAHRLRRQAVCLVADEESYLVAAERFDRQHDPVKRFLFEQGQGLGAVAALVAPGA